MTRSVKGLTLPWVEPEDFAGAHLAGRERAFWLDGAGARSWSGRHSYVGWLRPTDVSLTYNASRQAVTTHQGGADHVSGHDIFAALQEHPTDHNSRTGWVGYLGYASRPDLPALLDETGSISDACWLRAERLVAFDHERCTVTAVGDPPWHEEVADLIAHTPTAAVVCEPPPAAIVRTVDSGAYAEAFVRVSSELRRGNSYETNLTYRTEVDSALEPLTAYRRLRRLNPAPYAGFLCHRGISLLSSSPERFATITSDGWLETRPIKGTTPRHDDPDEDAAASVRLRIEPKFRGENLMIVDLLRNDMSMVCDVGTVEVTDLMHVESYPTVHQLVTTIRGHLRADVSTVDAIRVLFPGGSMTGAPKRRTMQIIANVESSSRGPYAGAFGWVGDDGRADLGVVIRSLVHGGGRYTMGTGGGVTVRSDCDEEYAETRWKVSTLFRALGGDGGSEEEGPDPPAR